jgi:hypothetical protein
MDVYNAALSTVLNNSVIKKKKRISEIKEF